MRLQLCDGGNAARRTLLFAIATCIGVASATPSITLPLSSQVPPVVRAGQAFSFTFSPSTFTSDSTINYSLKSGPTWLSLDGGTRTLSGKPPTDADLVTELEIEATDSTGSALMISTLAVSSRSAPEVVITLSEQIDKFADYSAPNSLLFYPSTSFRFSFDQRTFRTSGRAGLNKYAVTFDNAPLPSWINFDAETMTFSGETPGAGCLISPPEQFGIQLIASEIIGFAEVAIPFYFVVENHMLIWDDSFLDINVTMGSQIDFKDLAGKLELDGRAVWRLDLAAITSDAPGWLKFDASTFTLSGTVPDDASSVNVTVSAKDKFDDVAAVMISIEISGGIFADTEIAPLNATIGEPFSYDVAESLVDSAKNDISISIVPETTWLSYNPQTFILSGEVPDMQQRHLSLLLLALLRIPSCQNEPRTRRALQSMLFLQLQLNLLPRHRPMHLPPRHLQLLERPWQNLRSLMKTARASQPDRLQ